MPKNPVIQSSRGFDKTRTTADLAKSCSRSIDLINRLFPDMQQAAEMSMPCFGHVVPETDMRFRAHMDDALDMPICIGAAA